jgi:hypothetical protein
MFMAVIFTTLLLLCYYERYEVALKAPIFLKKRGEHRSRHRQETDVDDEHSAEIGMVTYTGNREDVTAGNHDLPEQDDPPPYSVEPLRPPETYGSSPSFWSDGQA